MIHRKDDHMLDISVEIFTKQGHDVPKPLYTSEFGVNLSYDEAMKFLASGNYDEHALFTIMKQGD